MISMAMLVGGVWFAALGFRPAGFIAVLGIGAVWVSSLAQLARRLHDRNRSGYWIVAPLLCNLMSYGLEKYALINPHLVLVILAVLLPFSVWFIVETFFRNGTAGPNCYGADPRSPPQAAGTWALDAAS
jgi:uncharacterized membrane protein YhaH (DUF805 family)